MDGGTSMIGGASSLVEEGSNGAIWTARSVAESLCSRSSAGAEEA
jgi:hypothetical protein